MRTTLSVSHITEKRFQIHCLMEQKKRQSHFQGRFRGSGASNALKYVYKISM